MIKAVLFLVASVCALASPVDFGQQELRAALAERGITLNITTELSTDQPETYHISAVTSTSARISGGDLRGLMYGLIDAAEQIRNVGKLTATAQDPGMAVRGVRVVPTDTDLMSPGFYNYDKWSKFFDMLARNRMNRVTLVLPVGRLEGDRIRTLSEFANAHAVDFMVGIRGTNGERTLQTQIRKLLEDCVRVRGVQLEVGREPAEFYRTTVFPAVQAAGRRVVLDLHGVESRPDVARLAETAGIAVEVSARSSGGAAGLPFHTVVTQSADEAAAQVQITRIGDTGAAGFEVELSGPNVDNYERVYWVWGRHGYDNHQPTLTSGKAPPAPKGKKK